MGTTERREPAYLAVAEDLRAAIRTGRHGESGRLPTEAELAKKYGLSRQTIRRAYRDLVTEGIVTRVRGRGTFPVAPATLRTGWNIRSFGSIEDLLSLSLDTELEVIDPMHLVVDPGTAALLGLQLDDVYEMSWIRRREGLPICHTTAAVPPAIADGLRDTQLLWRGGATSPTTVIALVERVAGGILTGAKQTITAVALPESIADLVGGSAEEPALCVERLYFAGDGRPVQLSVSYFNSARYSYRLLLQRAG
jgi:DNA-binding GntR family transcriptional regulator